MLDQLCDRPKPALSNNFQKQTRLRRMRLKDASTQVCRRGRDQARVFWIAMKENQTRGNEQCRAATLIVLHARRARRFYLRALATSSAFAARRSISIASFFLPSLAATQAEAACICRSRWLLK